MTTNSPTKVKEAFKICLEAGFAGTSLLCRKMGVNYEEAQNLINYLESIHAISEFEGDKPRKVLVKSFEDLNP